jgi:pimeloyl-ACP methyl ester carboxylesterase
VQTLTLVDGRALAYEDGGARDGTPVLFQHGTGDSRLCKYPDDSVTAALGIRLVTADRPGVGGSTMRKGRSLLDWVPDVEALADQLGIEQFVVAGHSGGGPHALAVASALGERVTKIGLASPLVPFDEKGNKKLVLDKDLKLVFRLSHLRFLASAAGAAEAHHYAKDVSGFVEHCAKTYPEDRDVFLDPVLRPMFEAEFGEALKHRGQGSLADFWAFENWGFEIDHVTQHVELFAGDADTILDPAGAEHYVRRLPDCVSHTWAGAGHYGVFARERWEEFLGSLV